MRPSIFSVDICGLFCLRPRCTVCLCPRYLTQRFLVTCKVFSISFDLSSGGYNDHQAVLLAVRCTGTNDSETRLEQGYVPINSAHNATSSVVYCADIRRHIFFSGPEEGPRNET